MTWEESLIETYLDEKGRFKKATRNRIIILSIGLALIIFSIFIPSKALIVPATGICIAIVITLYKNRNIKKDNEISIDDTLKKIDDPHKFT